MATDGTRKSHAGSDEQLLASLVAGFTIETAAKQANMSERTAHRRLRQPEFRVRLDELRSNTLSVAADRLAALALGASITLGEIMSDRDQPAQVRVSAAREVLRATPTLRESATIEARLEALEAALRNREALRLA